MVARTANASVGQSSCGLRVRSRFDWALHRTCCARWRVEPRASTVYRPRCLHRRRAAQSERLSHVFLSLRNAHLLIDGSVYTRMGFTGFPQNNLSAAGHSLIKHSRGDGLLAEAGTPGRAISRAYYCVWSPSISTSHSDLFTVCGASARKTSLGHRQGSRLG